VYVRAGGFADSGLGASDTKPKRGLRGECATGSSLPVICPPSTGGQAARGTRRLSSVDYRDWNDAHGPREVGFDLPACTIPFRNGHNPRRLAIMLGASALFASAGSLTPVRAESVTRDLSNYSTQSVTFTVSITIDADPTTDLVGLEEAPPAGWSVSAISNGGEWDDENSEVKWLFFSPPFPDVVTYDVTPPGDAGGGECFSGIANFDGIEQPISGDLCLSGPVPTISEWGLVVLVLLMLTTGSLLLIRPHGAELSGTTIAQNESSLVGRRVSPFRNRQERIRFRIRCSRRRRTLRPFGRPSADWRR
jgi:hypothetical protein